MKNVTKIVILTMYAVLSLSSCRKVHITPEETKTPLGFTAVSQTGMVNPKTKSLTDYEGLGFGVWGIARTQASENPYILWNNAGFMYAKKDNRNYVPNEAAYWLGGYTYRFIACAPYNNGTDLGLSNFAVSTASETSKDAVSFSYDMSIKAKDYDLLGAAAKEYVEVGAYQQAQQLIFWHLLSKININISFTGATDAEGKPTEVVNVSEMVLRNVKTKATYKLSFDENDELSVDVSDYVEDGDIQFKGSHGEVNIIPQDVSDIIMELDFTVGEGANAIPTTNYQIDMGAVHTQAGVSPEYIYNGVYNWTITINPKTISFDVKVTDWQTATGLPDFEIK